MRLLLRCGELLRLLLRCRKLFGLLLGRRHLVRLLLGRRKLLWFLLGCSYLVRLLLRCGELLRLLLCCSQLFGLCLWLHLRGSGALFRLRFRRGGGSALSRLCSGLSALFLFLLLHRLRRAGEHQAAHGRDMDLDGILPLVPLQLLGRLHPGIPQAVSAEFLGIAV